MKTSFQLIWTPLHKAICTDGNPFQIGNRCSLPKPQPGMAVLTIMPTFFCCLFTANYWRKVEVGTRQKLLTFPLVLIQLYLPFSDFRFAYQILQNDRRVIAAKKFYEITMATLGMSPRKNSNKEFISIDTIPFKLFFRDFCWDLTPIFCVTSPNKFKSYWWWCL